MLRYALPAALALIAAPALAASPFDGTWKADLAKSKFSDTPMVLLLAKGVYSCKSCTPQLTVPADGKFHPVTGRPYTDAVSAKMEGPRTLVTMGQKAGKPVSETRMTVSADGKTLTTESKRTNLVTGKEATSRSEAMRVAPAPAGAAAISGSWRDTAVLSASDGATTQTLAVNGDTLTLSTPTGEGYTATFGGPAVLQKNDPGKTMVAVKRLAPDHIVETDSRMGKVVQTYDMKVSPDGGTLTMVVHDRRDGSTFTATMTKQ